jgi:hypothetical protein
VKICIVNYLYIVLNINCVSILCLGLINWYQSMATNCERIESLDTDVYQPTFIKFEKEPKEMI